MKIKHPVTVECLIWALCKSCLKSLGMGKTFKFGSCISRVPVMNLKNESHEFPSAITLFSTCPSLGGRWTAVPVLCKNRHQR